LIKFKKMINHNLLTENFNKLEIFQHLIFIKILIILIKNKNKKRLANNKLIEIFPRIIEIQTKIKLNKKIMNN